ncbi:MAG: glycosyltransferase family 4 protein [Gemmatimonadetes bacterium]|jgi:glycosyltransferase involved in cell wall biosynthesis|nr:glycosyltransferase family 4 protein [Gemmatimonadota bacterium]MBT7859687.1 glycosyltransferase family 4 protein [Gemmatimonadota bacterium]
MPERASGTPQRHRVLHVITRLDRGGSAENTLLTVAHLDPDVYEVTLACGPSRGPMSPTLDLARKRGVRVVDIPHLIRSPSPWHDLSALISLWRLSRGFDLVHTHTSKAGILGRLAARLARVRRVVHTPHGHVFYGYYSSLVTHVFVQLERWAAHWCDRIVALTDADLSDHLDFAVAPATQFIVIHSGVDLQALDQSNHTRAQVRQALQIPEDVCLVGTVGRLTAIKGQSDLLRAVAQLDASVWLLMVGDGEEEEALRALAAQLGIAERVVFSGWRSDTGDMLRSIDLFAFSSLNEGMGKALVEAMYLQRPIVATAVGGVPQLITDDVHGLLVPARSPERLAQALRRLQDEPGLSSRLVEEARQRSCDFGVDSMMKRIEAMYRELLAEGDTVEL